MTAEVPFPTDFLPQLRSWATVTAAHGTFHTGVPMGAWS